MTKRPADTAFQSSEVYTKQVQKLSARERTVLRAAGGEVWQDHSLLEWDPNDFRLFCGDLGKEVNDEILVKAFNKYPSFQKAKVIRDKQNGKTKGYGFVSFSDPDDFIRAFREMDGKYVGNRPIKLRKSNWKERNLDVRLKKEQETGKRQLIDPPPIDPKTNKRRRPRV